MSLRVTVEQVSSGNSAAAVLEFGTTLEAMFAAAAELDFGDVVRVRTADGVLDELARVVAIQAIGPLRAVAVKFPRRPPNWLVR